MRGHQQKRNVKSVKSSISLKKSLKAIAPKVTTTGAAIDVQVVTEAGAVSKSYNDYDTTVQQIVAKD